MQMNMLPDWLLDVDLKNGDRETLAFAELKFWNDLIDSYLKPLELSEDEKTKVADALVNLRDMVIMAFIMINALFVLVIFLLQLNKEQLHIKWPLQAKNFISYDDTTREITIVREYLELEPLGFVFVIFFGLVLFIQFISMLKHRFGTVSEILASTSLDWYCSKRPDQVSPESDLQGQAVNISRKLQRPKQEWDDEEPESGKSPNKKRDTVRKLINQHHNKQDWSNLESNFKRRFFTNGEMDLGRLTVRRETMVLLKKNQKSMIDARLKRKSRQFGPPTAGNGMVILRNDGLQESNVDEPMNSQDLTDTRTNIFLENSYLGFDNRAYISDEKIELQQTRKSVVKFNPDLLDSDIP